MEGSVASILPSPLSLLLFFRDPNGFNDWTFSTVRCWGERAQGTYRLVISDVGKPSFFFFRAMSGTVWN